MTFKNCNEIVTVVYNFICQNNCRVTWSGEFRDRLVSYLENYLCKRDKYKEGLGYHDVGEFYKDEPTREERIEQLKDEIKFVPDPAISCCLSRLLDLILEGK